MRKCCSFLFLDCVALCVIWPSHSILSVSRQKSPRLFEPNPFAFGVLLQAGHDTVATLTECAWRTCELYIFTVDHLEANIYQDEGSSAYSSLGGMNMR